MKKLTLSCIILLLTSCSTSVLLPGLCYSDRTGTYLCDEDISTSSSCPSMPMSTPESAEAMNGVDCIYDERLPDERPTDEMIDKWQPALICNEDGTICIPLDSSLLEDMKRVA